jgi:alkylhydroperoxidase/carboxymuconolactone decarboxylase family protein YurZ
MPSGVSDAFQAFQRETPGQAGASREEILSALLVGLPACGLGVTQALPAALRALDEK